MADVRALVGRQPAGHSLLRPFYLDDAIFRADIEGVFMRHWLCAGHAGSAPGPGDYFTYAIAGESIIIVRGKDGALRALVNVCRHRGSRICLRSEGHASVLVCPYHAWAYNLDGSIRSARTMPKDFDAASYGLKQIHLREIEGLVMVSFADAPLNLSRAEAGIRAAHGPYGWADAKVAHRQTYAIDANWKLAVENYVECYHCAPAHPEYSKLHALERPIGEIAGLNSAMEARTRALGVEVGVGDHWAQSEGGEEAVRTFRYALHEGVLSASADGAPLAPPMGAFTGFDGGVTSTHLGPASFFVAYADHGVIYKFMPLTPTACAMELVWLVRGGAVEGKDYDKAKLTWLWQVTSDADKRIVEDNMAGVRSRFYQPGPYAPMEATLSGYVAWYLRELEGAEGL